MLPSQRDAAQWPGDERTRVIACSADSTREVQSMIVITGATGNTGRPAAEVLLTKGEKIRVIGRDAQKLDGFVQRGAEALAADVQDTDAMTRAFEGASA